MKSSDHACCNREVNEITEDQLPLCCPMPGERLWDGHPRVYLPLEKAGRLSCPYCGSIYQLKK